eukprot:SAG22_NODE_4791_length_1162_cov_3.126883_1_plen_326_part_00
MSEVAKVVNAMITQVCKQAKDDETIAQFGGCPYTMQDLIRSKTHKPDKEILTNLTSLMKYKADKLEGKDIGNKVIYKFFIKELMKCTRDVKGYKTIYEVMADPTLKRATWAETCRINSNKIDGTPQAKDMYEYHRGAKGCIAVFRPAMAKHIYTRYNATSVLDPCAGWGGRLLGAFSKNINYTGFDTNTSLAPCYDALENYLNSSKFRGTAKQCVHFEDCMGTDFSTIKYDFVFTSPPYENLELYEGMTPWTTEASFYIWLATLIKKCRDHIQPGGKVCFNISIMMYEKLTQKYHYDECSESFSLCNKKSNRGRNKKEEFCYTWC